MQNDQQKSVPCIEGRRLLSAQEMANVLAVPISWIYQRTMRGQQAIPHIKFGKYVRFDPDAVIAHFAQRKRIDE